MGAGVSRPCTSPSRMLEPTPPSSRLKDRAHLSPPPAQRSSRLPTQGRCALPSLPPTFSGSPSFPVWTPEGARAPARAGQPSRRGRPPAARARHVEAGRSGAACSCRREGRGGGRVKDVVRRARVRALGVPSPNPRRGTLPLSESERESRGLPTPPGPESARISTIKRVRRGARRKWVGWCSGGGWGVGGGGR